MQPVVQRVVECKHAVTDARCVHDPRGPWCVPLHGCRAAGARPLFTAITACDAPTHGDDESVASRIVVSIIADVD